MLQVSDLSKAYPTARGPLPVLSGVSFSLSPGDAAAIMGPSGSGKSSLLYLLGALEPPTSGTIVLDGRNPFELPPRELAAFRNKAVGFVFQDHCLLPQCTVLENVLIPTLVAPAEPDARLEARATSGGQSVGRGSSRANAREDPYGTTARARDLVAQVGLADRIDHRPGELSGGERQRVAIARALVRQPRLLLCDEPTGNLDRASAEHVAALILDLHRRQQTMLIVVTHSETLASKFPIRFELLDRRLERR